MLLGKSSDRKIPWGQLFIEAALVVFSVLLALGVKSCNDTQVQEELASKALRNFQYEVESNKAEIERVFTYHKELLDTLSSEDPPTGISLRGSQIQNNAWEAAQSTGAISYIDFSIIEIASKIEESQSQYQTFTNEVEGILLRGNFESGEVLTRVSNGLKIIMQVVVGRETELLKQYETALKRLEAAGISVKEDTTQSAKAPPDEADTLSK